jgi:hypothetical protein
MGGKIRQVYEASALFSIYRVNGKHQFQIRYWPPELLKRYICRAWTTSVVVQVADADPCNVARKKFHPTLCEFLKTLPTGPHIEHNFMLIGTLVPPKFLADGG